MTTIPADVVVPETEPGGRIFQTCEHVLRSVVAIFMAAGVEVPDLRFVSDGNVAYDDELLAVEATGLQPGRPGIPSVAPVAAGTVYSLTLVLHLIRKAPTPNDAGEPPTADELNDSARQYLNDWWTLLNGIVLGRARGAYGDPGDLQGAPFREIMVQQILPYGPNDLGGIVATLVCELV